MKHYTVIGLDETTGAAHRGVVRACSEYEAMRLAALAAYNPSGLVIIGAIEGEHMLYTPGGDNHATAYAIDLRGENV